jgi:CotH kinase protein
MPAHSDWLLHGPERDKTLGMRNVLAYTMWAGMGHWGPRVKYCELFLVANDSSDVPSLSSAQYQGVFLATESVSRGPQRVDVEELDFASDPSGMKAAAGGFLGVDSRA